jgi:Uma2 family endonuclease
MAAESGVGLDYTQDVAATPTHLISFAEFERSPDPRAGKQELQHGEVVIVAPAKHGHKRIQHTLRDKLAAQAGQAWVAVIEYGFRPVQEYEYRIADVALISVGRWDSIDPNGYLERPPELVIEVLSPSNTASEMLDRRDVCLHNGAREFWVVDPARNSVEVFTPDGRSVSYKLGQSIPLFFGGTLAVNEVFQ